MKYAMAAFVVAIVGLGSSEAWAQRGGCAGMSGGSTGTSVAATTGLANVPVIATTSAGLVNPLMQQAMLQQMAYQQQLAQLQRAYWLQQQQQQLEPQQYSWADPQVSSRDRKLAFWRERATAERDQREAAKAARLANRGLIARTAAK